MLPGAEKLRLDFPRIESLFLPAQHPGFDRAQQAFMRRAAKILADIHNIEPAGENFAALDIRFAITCRKRLASTRM